MMGADKVTRLKQKENPSYRVGMYPKKKKERLVTKLLQPSDLTVI